MTAGDALGRHDTTALRTGSLRARTVVSILVLLVVLLGALAVAVEALLGARLHAQIEDRLRDRASAAAALVGTVDADDLADRLSMQGLSVKIVQANGAAVEAGPTPAELKKGPPDPTALPVPPVGRGSAADRQRSDDTAGAGAAGAASGVTITASSVREQDGVVTLVSHLSDDSTITLTTGTQSVDQTLTELGWVMGGASAGFLLLAAAGLVIVVRRSLRPLDDMTAAARSIASGDRGRRLRPARRDTEIGRVAAAFDEMLDAVEGAERQALDAELRMRSFVSDAAHELRTPVAGIRAAADALVRAPLGSDDRERLATHVVRQSGRASRLVDDMLTMTRVDRGLDLDVHELDLGDFLRAETERLRLRLPSLTLDVLVPPEAAVVVADADRLAQVVGNLVDNAARATGGRGHVRLEVDIAPGIGDAPGTGDASDAVDASDPRDVVTLRVSDDGPGVPVADRERIFDRLVRLDEARSDRSGGAGLGLPIARGIARAHGGDVVCLESDSGAVFAVTLPAARVERGAGLAGGASGSGRASGAVHASEAGGQVVENGAGDARPRGQSDWRPAAAPGVGHAGRASSPAPAGGGPAARDGRAAAEARVARDGRAAADAPAPAARDGRAAADAPAAPDAPDADRVRGMSASRRVSERAGSR